MFQIHGNGIENSFTHIGKRQCDEDKTFHEYGCQSHLPGITHLEYYGVCKISIQSHAGRQHKRIIGKGGHQQGGDQGCKGSGCKDSASVHSRGAQDVRIHCKDVGHCHERGDTGNYLCFDICVVFRQVKYFFQESLI